MKDALNHIVTCIVDKKDSVNIEETEENGVINFTIEVDKDDMGKIIGRGGKVIKAIRNVMKIPAIKEEKKIYISLKEQPL